MTTSKNGVEYTHTVYIQDIKLVDDVKGSGHKDGTLVIGGKKHKWTCTANPGVWYINNPLDVKVGDAIFFEHDETPRYEIVDIGEYPPQPTLRTLYIVIP
jgi:hypothetical protein